MSIYDTFRDKNHTAKVVEDKIAANFIFSGNLATVISVNNVNISAALAYVNVSNGYDRVYTYTYSNVVLPIGTNYTWKNDYHYVVVDYDKMVKNTFYNKYVALECNFSLSDAWGYFKGPMQSYVDTQILDGHIEESQAKPIAILPRSVLNVSDKIVINGRPWLIIERDDYSTDGLTYYSLQATTDSKPVDDSTLLPASVIDNSLIQVKGLDVITLSTEDAFFNSDKKFDVTRTINSIVFTVPFGYNEFYIKVKQNGEVKTFSYKVVL